MYDSLLHQLRIRHNIYCSWQNILSGIYQKQPNSDKRLRFAAGKSVKSTAEEVFINDGNGKYTFNFSQLVVSCLFTPDGHLMYF